MEKEATVDETTKVAQRPYEPEAPDMFPEAPRIRVMRIEEVMGMTGLKRSTLYELMAKGQFPIRLQLTQNTVGWYEHEVLAWISQLRRLPHAGDVEQSL